jgi:hypothetical protein
MDKIKGIAPSLVALLIVGLGFAGVSVTAEVQTTVMAAIVAVLAAGDSLLTVYKAFKAKP